MQLTPTAIYDLEAAGVTFAHIVVLGSKDLDTGSGYDFQLNMEHWFLVASIESLPELLGGETQTLELRLAYESATSAPDPTMVAKVKSIESTCSLQLLAKAVLDESDWTDGPVAGAISGLDAYLFVDEANPDEQKNMRLVVCVDSGTPNKIARVVWLTKDTSTTNYVFQTRTLTKANMAAYENDADYSYYLAP